MTTNEGSMSNIKEMRAASWSAVEIGSELARAFLARFEQTVRAKAAGELQRIEEAEEDDEEWDLKKVRARLAQKHERRDAKQDPERKLLEIAREAAAAVLAKFGALNDIDPDDVGVPREPVKHAKRGRPHDAYARRTRPRAEVRQDQRQTDIRHRARTPAHFDSGIGDSHRRCHQGFNAARLLDERARRN